VDFLRASIWPILIHKFGCQKTQQQNVHEQLLHCHVRPCEASAVCGGERRLCRGWGNLRGLCGNLLGEVSVWRCLQGDSVWVGLRVKGASCVETTLMTGQSVLSRSVCVACHLCGPPSLQCRQTCIACTHRLRQTEQKQQQH